MLLPYVVDVPMKRLPIANWAIIAVTIAVGFPSWADWSGYCEELATSEDLPFLILIREDGFHWSQLLGHLFGHAGIGHLLGNMWMLFLYGNAVNAKVGQIQYVLLYFAVGILDGLIWLWVGDGPATLGASGAVMGMIGAFVVLYPRNDVTVFYWLGFVRAGTFEVSAYIVIAIYVLLDLIGFIGPRMDNTNHLAHLAGAALGFGALAIANATGLLKADPGEHTMIDILTGKGTAPRKGVSTMPLRGHSAGNAPYRRPPTSNPGQTRRPNPPGVQMPRQSILDDSPIPLADEPPPPPRPRPPTRPKSGT